MTPTAPARLFSRAFTPYWLGVAGSALGDALVFVSLPFLVLRLGGDGASLATVVLLASVPRFAGPLLGALADRLPLRIPLLAGSVARAVLIGALALLALLGTAAPWVVELVAPANAFVALFTVSASNVALPRIVPAQRLAAANALMQAATMGAPLIGFGAGGALVAVLGPAVTLGLATPFLLSLAAAMAIVRLAPGLTGESAGLVGELLSGARFLARRPSLAVLLLASLVLNASLNLLNVLMPLAMERNRHGAAGYGLFETLVSAGALAGILLVTLLSRRLATRHMVTLSQALVALGFALLAGGALPRLLGAGAVIGAGLGLGEVAAVTLLQLTVPDGLRGKVLGLVMFANALGLTVGASVARAAVQLGNDAAVVVGAAIALAIVMLLWGTLSRGLAERTSPAPRTA